MVSTMKAQTHVRTDSEIQKAVLEELRWDTRVTATHIGVAVDSKVVTLAGTVDSYLEKLAAQEAAHRVTGVLDVVNNLTIDLPGTSVRSDTDIAHAVRLALEWDVNVPHEQIRSTVANGWVALDGKVEGWYHRRDAERAVKHLVGVVGVTNRIAVVPPSANPAQVRTLIHDTLERQAGKEAMSIDVRVDNGVLTLAGKVRSWAERRAIYDAAGHAPGVNTVIDQLRVDPYS